MNWMLIVNEPNYQMLSLNWRTLEWVWDVYGRSCTYVIYGFRAVYVPMSIITISCLRRNGGEDVSGQSVLLTVMSRLGIWLGSLGHSDAERGGQLDNTARLYLSRANKWCPKQHDDFWLYKVFKKQYIVKSLVFQPSPCSWREELK